MRLSNMITTVAVAAVIGVGGYTAVSTTDNSTGYHVITTKLDNIQGDVNTITLNMSGVQTDIASMKTELTATSNRVKSLEEQVDDLEDKDTELERRLERLEQAKYVREETNIVL